MANTYLQNSNPTAGNRTKATFSCWLKKQIRFYSIFL